MYLPRTIIHGGGSIRRLGALLGDMGLKRPLVVADKFLASPQSGAVDEVCDQAISNDILATVPDAMHKQRRDHRRSAILER